MNDIKSLMYRWSRNVTKNTSVLTEVFRTLEVKFRIEETTQIANLLQARNNAERRCLNDRKNFPDFH